MERVINFRVVDSPDSMSRRYVYDGIVSGERLRYSFDVDLHQISENPQMLDPILEYKKKHIKHMIHEKEQEVVSWTADTSSTTTTYVPHYRYYTTSTATDSTVTATYTTSGNWSPTSSASTWITYDTREYFYDRAAERDQLYYVDNVWIRKADLTHAQVMQLKIDQEWRELCREEERVENRRLYVERERARNAAEDKALILLSSFIGEEELEKYKETGQIYVRGRNGLYLAKKGGGVSKIEGKKITNFCVYTDRRYKCPPTDDVIALKTMLEHDDNKVIQIANRMSTREVKELPLAACM